MQQNRTQWHQRVARAAPLRAMTCTGGKRQRSILFTSCGFRLKFEINDARELAMVNRKSMDDELTLMRAVSIHNGRVEYRQPSSATGRMRLFIRNAEPSADRSSSRDVQEGRRRTRRR